MVQHLHLKYLGWLFRHLSDIIILCRRTLCLVYYTNSCLCMQFNFEMLEFIFSVDFQAYSLGWCLSWWCFKSWSVICICVCLPIAIYSVSVLEYYLVFIPSRHKAIRVTEIAFLFSVGEGTYLYVRACEPPSVCVCSHFYSLYFCF